MYSGCSMALQNVFDYNDMQKNIKKYTVSNAPMDEMSCGLTSILFSKEALNALKSNKKPDMNIIMGDKTNPTTIDLLMH